MAFPAELFVEVPSKTSLLLCQYSSLVSLHVFLATECIEIYDSCFNYRSMPIKIFLKTELEGNVKFSFSWIFQTLWLPNQVFRMITDSLQVE